MKVLAGFLFAFWFAYVNAECPTTQVVCYYSSWAIYRPDDGQFNISSIDASLCTHIIYTFVGLDINLHIASIDPTADIVQGGFNTIVNLKNDNECLRVSLAIGGWNEGSRKYSVMAATPESREEFAEGALKFLVYYGFDGLDLDWEYPTQRGGIAADKESFVELLVELKKKFSPYNLTLTTAVPIDTTLIGTAFDIAEIYKNVDYIHLMAYDYVTSDSNVTQLDAPISKINKTIDAWLKDGLTDNSNKLILGLPAYGRYFILEDNDQHGINAPVKSPGEVNEYTGEKGYLTFFEIDQIVDDDYTENCEDSCYAYLNEYWITYDNEETYKEKVKNALDRKLGGVMVWSIDTDTFQDGSYKILNTIKDAISEYKGQF